MSRIVKEDKSLLYYIKNEVLVPYFTETTTEDLELDASMLFYVPITTVTPSPVGTGRGWVYFDNSDFSKEQTTRVSISGAYLLSIDYTNRRIYTVSGVPSTITYDYNYISVIDSWPNYDMINQKPIVAIDMYQSTYSPFQMGGGKINKRNINIHIFATNKTERDNITEVIFNGVYERSINLYDYDVGGDPLDYNGRFNNGYLSNPIIGRLEFSRVDSANINVSGFSEADKYRSRISLTVSSIEEQF